MDKYQEALDALKSYADSYITVNKYTDKGKLIHFQRIDDKTKIIQELVDKEKPVKPIYREFMVGTPYHEYAKACPRCNSVISLENLGKKHCVDCGVEFDWNE